MNHPDTLLFVGAPASGKTSLATRLADETGQFAVSLGSLFRDARRGTLPLGKQQYEKLNAFGSSPRDKGRSGIYLLKTYLTLAEQKGYFSPQEQFLLLDGMPRYGSQAGFLSTGVNLHFIGYLDIDKDTTGKRESLREASGEREVLTAAHRNDRWKQYHHQCSLLEPFPQSIKWSIDARPSLDSVVQETRELLEKKGLLV